MEETKVPLKKVEKVVGLETVPSTQDLALELARRGEAEGTMVLACEQTAARRLDGSRFHAPEGGIYFTLILRPRRADLCAFSLSRQAAQAVAETLTAVFGLRTKVKDGHSVLVWDKKKRQWKKTAGILAETFFEENGRFALVGVGVHVNNRPAAGKEPGLSLKQCTGAEISKELLLDELLNGFWKQYACWLQSAC